MQKVFRDPIHSYIEVTDEIIWELINTPAFQRLNNIKQLGGAFQIFHGAMHTRFGHSLGAYFIAKQMIDKVDNLAASLTEREQRLLCVAALLHDIGHGPFSHASESFLALHHETMTCRIILEHKPIRAILDKVDAIFAEDVVQVLKKRYKNPLLAKLVSSQVDVDRMDYLLRDAYYAGVPYGTYDKERIIHVMQIVDGNVVFRESGVYAVEDFMLSRYHMRSQVYMNAKGRVFEIMFYYSIKRFMELWKQGLIPENILFKQLSLFLASSKTSDVEDFIALDDHAISTIERLFQDSDDPILARLAVDLTTRRLPKAYELPNRESFLAIQEALQKLEEQGSEIPFFVYCEQLEEQTIYYSGQEKDAILIRKKNGAIVPIEEASTIIASLDEQLQEHKYYLYINQKYIRPEHESYTDTLKAVGIL